MGFKKTGKKKVKKAPGKKGRKDGWDFEGGTFTEEASKGDEKSADGSKPEKRGPRKTQERDEYIRRGKAKIEDRKRKWQSEKKMSKKISFNDILNGDSGDIEEAVEVEEEEVEVEEGTTTEVELELELELLLELLLELDELVVVVVAVVVSVAIRQPTARRRLESCP